MIRFVWAGKMTLTKESLFLIGICTFDLASTLLLLDSGGAMEGNPLMSFYLRYGVGTFVLVKLALIFFPIFIAEWGKQYRPRFVRFMLRATIATYLGIYLLAFLTINVAGIISAQRVAYHPPANVVATR